MSAIEDKPRIFKGLAGVVVDTTSISEVVPETNSLTYRGYPVQDLAAHCSFEQVAYLLWHGELPTGQQLTEFTQQERAARGLDRSLLSQLTKLPGTCHPMDSAYVGPPQRPVTTTVASQAGAAGPKATTTGSSPDHSTRCGYRRGGCSVHSEVFFRSQL
ncbi:hypothetical protein A4G28_20125 [Mycobacterium ostraviense]|uniref:Citrate synthase n=1 Tax=Mycobacterium ostraviense TaxID=2738409 RepID=A0A163XKQ9_9MYCO|nr:hypothetical protein A4G28_20125 [Mycobacterium ostraviense]